MADERRGTDTVEQPHASAKRRISHFELIEELGSGGMGRVYRARDLNLHRTVALKMLRFETRGPDDQQRLLAEARAASALNHPGIVTIYEVGTADGVDFIAMELVEGESLATLLGRETLPPARVLSWAIELAEAIAVAHRRGIIHRDLKPDNVMVTQDQRLKILDFGIAKRLPIEASGAETPGIDFPQTATGLIVGTPAYMSPEQASGRPIDARTDLFSLGALLYQMLTGERPFTGGNSVELASAILRHHPDPPSRHRRDVEPAWDAVIARLLAKAPDDRYASADELLVALKALATRQQRRLSRRMLLVAGLGLPLLVAVGLYAWRSPSDPAPVADPATVQTPDRFPDFNFRVLSRSQVSQHSPSFSPDGSTVAFVAEDAAKLPQIWVTSVGGGEPLQITSGPPGAFAPDWAAGGDRIVFARAGQGIWEIPPLGGDARQLLPIGYAPNLSPDGLRLAYVAHRQPWVTNIDGGEPRALQGFEKTFFGALARPVFSPDGRQIVTFWPHDRRPLGDLWISPSDGRGPPRQLTHLQFLSNETAPVWSSDGRWILFSADHAGSVNLWRVAVTGGEPLAVTRGAGSDLSVDLSADNQRLVYTTSRNVARVAIFDPATGTHRTVFERREMIVRPELSPDGRQVAYFARVPHAIQLLVVDLASGKERQVTHGRGQINSHPRWSADGETLYYYQEEPTQSLRKVPVAGGQDELVVDGLRWSVENAAAISPDEKHVAYTVRDGNTATDARIRDLTSGEAWSLPVPLYFCRWSPDGQTIWGNTYDPEQIFRCAVRGACESVTAGEDVRPSADGRSIYFKRRDNGSYWRRDLASGIEERPVQLDVVDPLSFNWGVQPDGKIVYHVQDFGHQELWLGEAVK